MKPLRKLPANVIDGREAFRRKGESSPKPAAEKGAAEKGALIDMRRYRLPGSTNVVRLRAPIPTSDRLPFDPYDYETLFADERVKRMLREGETIGCFYIESPGMRSLLRRLGVDSFEALTAASSIIRPGVAESGMMAEFIARHRDPRRRRYLTPAMERYLGETYGVMVYQEDVIKVAHHVAGLSLEEADLLRRAMSGKMRSSEAMRRVRDRFFASAAGEGLPRRVVEELWRQIASFAGYSFCKAHSASFALLSYQVAYLKARYPAVFMANVLSNGGGYYSAGAYVNECKRLGLRVELPCVNRSERNYVGRGERVRIGLAAIKNLEEASIDAIVEARRREGAFVSLADFLRRTDLKREQTAALIACGAMDAFGETRATLSRLLDLYLRRRDLANDLFREEPTALEREARVTREESDAQKCAAEMEAFGYTVTRHPLEFFTEALAAPGVITASAMRSRHGERARMVGWYMSAKRVRTKTKKIMKFLSLEDLTGTFEATLFPEAYARYAEKTLSAGPYLVEGRVDAKQGNCLVVEKLEVLAEGRLRADSAWDGVEQNKRIDNDRATPEEIALVSRLGKEKLRRAYLVGAG